jgi:hypothetical protein
LSLLFFITHGELLAKKADDFRVVLIQSIDIMDMFCCDLLYFVLMLGFEALVLF